MCRYIYIYLFISIFVFIFMFIFVFMVYLYRDCTAILLLFIPTFMVLEGAPNRNQHFHETLLMTGLRINRGRVLGVLRGSWDLVTGVIMKVATLICTYNPN